MTSRQLVPKRELRSVVSALIVSATLLALGARPGWAGEPSAMMTMSGFILPLNDADVEIPSATVDIRLPEAGYGAATIRTEYEMRNRSDTAIRVRVALPLRGGVRGLHAFGPPDPKLQPAIKLDGAPLEYEYLGLEELAKPYLEQWAAKGWELLEATDPELKAQLEALDPTNHQVPRGTREALDAHVQANAEKWGERAKHWSYNVVKFLVFRHLKRLERDLWLTDVEGAIEFLDPEYTHDAYDLDKFLPEQWGLDVRLMRDPYDGRLYEPRFGGLGEPGWRGVGVLEFEVMLLPEKTHHLAIFYRQSVGYDYNMYRPGDLPSRQFCFVTKNAHKWRDSRWLHMVVRWPEGTKRISFGPRVRGKKRYWREGGYHNAAFSAGARWGNQHISWIARGTRRPHRDAAHVLAQ